MGEEKAAVLWGTGNPFHRERKGREVLRECGVGFAQEENLSDYRLER